MKKVIIIFISIVLILFMLILFMVINNNRYLDSVYEDIVDNTDIKEIEYLNKYDKNYIVMDKDYIYLISDTYYNLLKLELSMIYNNDKNYDIIYKDDKLMYFNDIYKEDKLIYEYYDIYTYELIDRVIVGG